MPPPTANVTAELVLSGTVSSSGNNSIIVHHQAGAVTTAIKWSFVIPNRPWQDCANESYAQHLPIMTWLFAGTTVLVLFAILIYFVQSKLHASVKLLSISVLLAHTGDESVEIYILLVLAKVLSNSLYFVLASMALLSVDGLVNLFFAVPVGALCDMNPKRRILIGTFICKAVMCMIMLLLIPEQFLAMYLQSSSKLAISACFVFNFGFAFMNVFGEPCFDALVTFTCEKEDLINANALQALFRIPSKVIGKVLGALLVQYTSLEMILICEIISVAFRCTTLALTYRDAELNERDVGMNSAGSNSEEHQQASNWQLFQQWIQEMLHFLVYLFKSPHVLVMYVGTCIVSYLWYGMHLFNVLLVTNYYMMGKGGVFGIGLSSLLYSVSSAATCFALSFAKPNMLYAGMLFQSLTILV